MRNETQSSVLAVWWAIASITTVSRPQPVLLVNSTGGSLGENGQDDLFAVLDARSAAVLIQAAEPPGHWPTGVPPFAAGFLLDSARRSPAGVHRGLASRST